MEDVPGERGLDIARRSRQIGKLDRGTERADRFHRRVPRGAVRQIARHVDGNLRLGDGL